MPRLIKPKPPKLLLPPPQDNTAQIDTLIQQFMTPEGLDYMDRIACERSLHSFLVDAWPSMFPAEFQDNWHLHAIAEHLEAVSKGQIRKLLINIMPRSSKTALVSLAWPAWTWAQEVNKQYPLIGPGVRFLSVTYAQGKSDEDALRARRLLTSPWYQKHWGERFDFMPDLNRTEHYANSKGGERISASFTGSVMGRGGDIKIIDDPHKMNEAESDTVREQVIRDFDEGIQNRSTDPRIAADVVIMQRSHNCLLPGTRVRTEAGEAAIETLGVGDTVYGSNGWQKIIATKKTEFSGNAHIIRLFGHPTECSTTPEHLYFTKRGWVEARNLTADDYVGFPHLEDGYIWYRVKTHRIEEYSGSVYDIETPSHDFVVGNALVHNSDLSGHLMEKEGWTYLVIPTEYESDRHCQVFVDGNLFWEDPRSEDGALLWPERFGPAELESFKELPYVWAGQYQQRPIPRGGGVIQAEWWQNWPPEGWKEKQGKEFPSMDFVLASLDTAYTEKRSNDFSALTVWGIFRDTGTTETIAVPNWKGGIIEHIPILSEDERSKVMLMYGWQRRLTLHGTIEPDDLRICWEDCEVCKKHTNEWHDEDCPAYTEQRKPYWGLVEWTVHLCKKYRVNKLLIEDSAAGKPVQQELARLHRNAQWNTELVTVRGDKLARAHAISPLFSTGRIWAPLDMDWARLVQDQLLSLGKTKHDDLADTCFVQGTLIATSRGAVPIENIVAGDEVLTPFGFRNVVVSAMTGVKPVVSRLGLTGTSNHPIFAIGRGWTPLGDLSEDSNVGRLSICGLIQTLLQKELFTTGSSSNLWGVGEDIISANQNPIREGKIQKDYMSLSGKMQTVCQCLLGMKSTISITIRLIAILRIYGAYRAACIVSSIKTGTESTNLPFWKKLGRRLLCGTKAKMDVNGIEKLRPNFLGALVRAFENIFPSLQPKEVVANGVDQNLRDFIQEKSCAHKNAGPNLLASEGENTNTSIHTTPQPVYNLTVEGLECYYANGILVHNCTLALKYLRDRGMAVMAREEDASNESYWRRSSKTQPLYDV